MRIDFEPKEKTETVVVKKGTDEIVDIFDGFHQISGNDYKESLPIEYFVIKTTTELLNAGSIEPKEKE